MSEHDLGHAGKPLTEEELDQEIKRLKGLIFPTGHGKYLEVEESVLHQILERCDRAVSHSILLRVAALIPEPNRMQPTRVNKYERGQFELIGIFVYQELHEKAAAFLATLPGGKLPCLFDDEEDDQ